MNTQNKEFLERNGFKKNDTYEYILHSESENNSRFLSICYLGNVDENEDMFSIWLHDTKNGDFCVNDPYQGSLEKFQLLVDCYKTYFQ